MAEELKDFRGKITRAIDVALEAESRVTGRDRAEIAREILQAWAVKKLHEATLLHSLAAAQGVRAEDQGIAGSVASSRRRRRER